MMTVYDLKIGQSGTINSIKGNARLAKRLLALGCVEETEVKVTKVAPFGDPIIIRLRGFDLAIRKDDAKNIYLK